MGKIIVSPDEFFSVIMVFLYDMIVNNEEILLQGKDIQGMIDKMIKKGMKSPLMQFYLNLNSEERLKYKRIKDSFYKKNAGETGIKIDSKKKINEDTNNLPENFYDLKDSIKRCITVMRKTKYKNPNRVITDDTMDKIIAHVLKEKEING